MSDIFVSYAHQDREWVARFAEPLHQVGGFEIWWDHDILPGEQFDDAIQNAMDQTRCVIVVWSKASVASRWVKTEAREAARREILVPVLIESVTPPLEFRSFETADLSGWQGEPGHENFRELIEALRQAVAKRTGATQDRTEPWPTNRAGGPGAVPAQRTRAYAIGGAIAAVLLVLALIGAARFTRPGISPTPPSSMPNTGSTPAPAATTSPRASIPAPPKLTYGVWTLHDAIDEDRNNWNNSVIKFTSQDEASDGLTLHGVFSWRLDNALVGTEEFTGHYVEATRQIFLEGTSVKDVPHPDPRRLAMGSYSAVVSADERSLVGGRWGQTAQSETGVLGRWEATR